MGQPIYMLRPSPKNGDHKLGLWYITRWNKCCTLSRSISCDLSFGEGFRRKTYFFGAYAFSLHPPFRIIAISAVPIVDEFLYTGPWYTNLGSNSYTYAPYPVSLMIEKKGVLLMSIGMNDDKGYLCHMRIRDLLESMAPVHYS
jgi:hypothetical protein